MYTQVKILKAQLPEHMPKLDLITVDSHSYFYMTQLIKY